MTPQIALQYPLFDKFIDCTFYIGDTIADAIKTPKSGIKPQIEFTWNRVPGQFTYKCSLQITNWFTNTKWYEYDSVKVTAGYSYQASRCCSFTCQIFNSYKPFGGPDTAAIFECIVAAADTPMLTETPYILQYYAKQTTVRTVLQTSAQKLGYTPILHISPQLGDETYFSSDIIEEAFASGNAVCNYLRQRCSDIVEAWGEHFNLIVFDTYIVFLQFDKDGQVYPTQEEASSLSNIYIPLLDQTTSVTFTAGTLTVEAPWNPLIEPGKIFWCDPATYNGATGLPNSVVRAGTHKDPSNCYYVITQKVTFSTVGNKNSMNIMAVRMSSSPAAKLITLTDAQTQGDAASKDAQKQIDKLIEELGKQYKKGLTTIPITFGAKEASTRRIYAFKDSWLPSSYQSTAITEDMTLADVAKKFFPKNLNGKLGVKIQRFAGYYIGYPLIALATYHYYMKTKDEKYKIDPNAPDNLNKDGKHYLIIPDISDYQDLNAQTELADELATMEQYFLSQGKNQWSMQMKLLADIVRKGLITEGN